MTNYAFTKNIALPSVTNNHVFDGCNFSQAEPNTIIFAGVSGLTFRRCNLSNCQLPADAIIEDCLRIQKSFCSHIHPRWVDKGLPECDEDCSHLVETDEIVIDGVAVDTIKHYKDNLV